MKRISTLFITALIIIVSCKKTDSPPKETDQPVVQEITERKCAAYEVLQEQIAADPSLRQRMDDIERFTQRVIANGTVARIAADGVLEIPVVVHVVWNTPAQNISDEQVQSQIGVLNEDYQNRNADRTQLPKNSFEDVASTGMNVRFVLDRIIRKQTTVTSWSTNDAVKNSKRGGSDPLDPSYYLNIWACNLGGGLLGYAQFPGGRPATDGVVCLYSAFGSRAKYPGGTYIKKYDLGRTTTHEVGHWMNLRHIWGDDSGACSGSDGVADTPNQGDENYGCPNYPTVSCSNDPKGDMFMNYMDYTDDACMYMFTQGQVSRMLAVFAANGPRAAMSK
ncbi:MAG: zinc metalloprotease [Flavisolibacter sp.]|nr:zinc metalloprotease [Flavisolibacter sp.]